VIDVIRGLFFEGQWAKVEIAERVTSPVGFRSASLEAGG